MTHVHPSKRKAQHNERQAVDPAVLHVGAKLEAQSNGEQSH